MPKTKTQPNINEIKRKAKQHWNKLTDEDLNQLQGNVNQLNEILQNKYNYTREQAQKSIEEFKRTLNLK